MKKIADYVAEGIPEVINDMGEHRKTRTDSIVFSNGWVASIVEEPDLYSVAICDYNGYFDWSILGKQFETDNGAVICSTEDQVCDVLEYIKKL
ncbi:MAG: hypothetical protein LUH21_04440 [Clostridiales bacterium]|nr:hypothetical protein [Clostridiales bacterium]